MKYTSKYFLLVVIAVLIYTLLSERRSISKYDRFAAVFEEKNPGAYCDGTVERVYDRNRGGQARYKCNGTVRALFNPPPSTFKPTYPGEGTTMKPPGIGMTEAQAAKLQHRQALGINNMNGPLTPYQRYLIARGGKHYCPGQVVLIDEYASPQDFRCSVTEKTM